MAKKVLSIEIGDWWTKVVLAEPYKRSPQVENMFYFRTPERSVDDGIIKERDKFVTALREALSWHQVTERDVIFIINSTKVITREISIPTVKDKMLPGIVAAQAPEHFPMDISGYTITYQKMGEFVDDDNKKQLKLALIAVPDSLLSTYMSIAKSGGFNIVSFEYIGNSVVSFAKVHYQTNNIVIQLEENATIVSIIVNRRLAFQRVVPNGYGNTLGIVMDHSILNVGSIPEAYHFLTTHNLAYKRPKVADLSTEEDQRRQRALEDAYADVREALSYHVRVALTALEYYRTQSRKDFYGVMRIVGDGARIAGIKKLFTDEIPLELVEDDMLSSVHLSRNIVKDDVTDIDFISAIGALISPLGIKPKEIAAQESRKSTMKVAYIGFAASLAVSLTLVTVGALKYLTAADEHDYLTRRIRELSYVQKVFETHEAAKKQAEEFTTFDVLSHTDNELFAELVAGLEKQLPTTVTVQSISVAEGRISINLTSPNKLTIAQMLVNLHEIPILDNVAIPSMAEAEDELGNISWMYSVTATYLDPFAILMEELENAAATAEPADDTTQE